MGEKQSHSADRAGEEEGGRAFGSWGFGGTWDRGASVALGLLSIMAVLEPGLISAARARGQDTPSQPAASAKDAAQREPSPSEPGQEPAPGSVEALSARYRFIEKYNPNGDPDRPELVSQYRVGMRETQKTLREKTQGAPDRFEISRQTIYTERAAQVNKLGEVLSAVRRYDKFQMTELAAARPPKTPMFEGLSVLYRVQPGQKPQILSLTKDRLLREFEYAEMAKQVFLPQLVALFPKTGKRVGDTWQIPPKATHALVGELPDADDYEMTGTLIEVNKAGSGPTLTAVIGVSGQLNLSHGSSALNARIEFVFAPASAVVATPRAGASPKSTGGTAEKRRLRGEDVDARGSISKVRMAWRASSLLTEDEGRLKQTLTYELYLERKLPSAPGEAEGGRNSPLPIPDPLPTADESNSWVLYEDPRFHFLHPQALQLSPQRISPNIVELNEENVGKGQDVFILFLPPGADDPQADRKFCDVDQFQRDIDADLAKKKVEILRGRADFLPGAEWAPWKVFRKEVGVKTAGADDVGKMVERLYVDYYLVLSRRNECFKVHSMTLRDDHVAFRNQAESIIKSFHFGPWDGRPKNPAAPPEPPLTPPK